MALKHKLARLVCAWDGHIRVHGYVVSMGTTYECICCDRCHKPLVMDDHPAYSVFAWSNTNMGRAAPSREGGR